MRGVAGVVVLLVAGHLLLALTCVDTASAQDTAPQPLMAQVVDGMHGHLCDQDLSSVVPLPDRPSMGQAALPLLPAITGAVPSSAIDSPPPDYPRAMARALLQVYRI